MDGVALAALVVGLVALLIASGQLMQQMFSTVDGYRRCQRSVIGPWARKTHLNWHWKQFRFETRFTTPEIVLYEWRALQKHRHGIKGAVTALDPTLEDIIALEQHDVPPELRETISPAASDEADDTRGDMVSWTSLLRQLYEMQSRWYQSYEPHTQPPQSVADVVGYANKVGVIYRERTWDLMPPDTIRPMASSRLGTIIILAIRLGMTWENLDIGGGVLRAEGNGHTLLSTMTRGLGIVFQYNFNPHTVLMYATAGLPLRTESVHQGMILRRSTDLLSCGIIPGIPSPHRIPAIPLNGKNIIETAALISTALLGLGVARSTVAQIANTEGLKLMQQQGYEAPAGWPINDMIALLSNFQPLKGSTRTQTVWPLQTNVALSVFLLPECRHVFLRLLGDHPRRQATNRTRLHDVYDRLKDLRDQHQADFDCEWDQAVVNDPSATAEKRTGFIEHLRHVFDWTTDYFVSIETQLKYPQLVAAHITLATKSAFACHNTTTPSHSTDSWTAVAHAYVNHLPGLLDELCLTGNVGRDAAEDAWWTLMLRGIVWRMSIYVSHQDAVVPSRLYFDQTPVYIM